MIPIYRTASLAILASAATTVLAAPTASSTHQKNLAKSHLVGAPTDGPKADSCKIVETAPTIKAENGHNLMYGQKVNAGDVIRLGSLAVRIDGARSWSGSDWVYPVDVKAPGYLQHWDLVLSKPITLDLCGQSVSITITSEYGYGDYLHVSTF